MVTGCWATRKPPNDLMTQMAKILSAVQEMTGHEANVSECGDIVVV